MKRIFAVVAAGLVPAMMWTLMISPGLMMVLSLLVFFLVLRGVSVKVGVRLGFLYGLVLYGVSLSWMWQIFSATSIALWMILAIFPAVAGGVVAWLTSRWNRAWWLPLCVACCCSAIEYFRCEWFWLRFPWMTAGTAMGPNVLTPFIGVYGVSFLATLAAAMFLLENQHRMVRLMVVASIMVLFQFPAHVPSGDGEAVRVRLHQSENLDFYTYFEEAQKSEFHDGIFLWPEASTSADVRVTEFDRNGGTQLDRVKQLAAERNAMFVFGQYRATSEGTVINEALSVDGSGLLGTHQKNRPVHFMNDGEQGKEARAHDTPWGRIGTPICFDNDYTEIARRMAADGAEMFLVPSLDAERWTRRQHWQHAEMFRLRAAETRRWMAVCASSGLSQIIDPSGKRIATVPMMEDAILEGTLHRRTDQTIYVRVGWLFPWLITAVALFWVGFLFVRSRRDQARL